MDRRRVLYYEMLRFQPESLALLRRHYDLVVLPNPDHDTAAVLGEISVVFAPLGYFWGKEKIDSAPELRVIASNTTGVPHIDTAYAERKGIKVVSLKGETEFLNDITPTAEHTWGLILGVMRRVPWAFQAVSEGRWDRRPFGGKGMLSRMSLGIVGFGRLGKIVARQALGFGMRVRYYDVLPQPVPPGVEPVGSLEELVAESDVVTVHIPLDERNKGLFEDRLFGKFKDGAYFVNTSRGEIVDSSALLTHLASGKLAGAALDVLDGEFERGFAARVAEHPLVAYARTHDNLLLTPHIGGSTIDAWRATEEFTIGLVLRALAVEGDTR